jgi:predicted RNA-binding Zn-ribbon protein involved in translation (DUF1610 family)
MSEDESITPRKILVPIKELGSNKECPICGQRLGFPALSRFDNETEVCSECGQIEGTGYLFSNFNNAQRELLMELPKFAAGVMTPWELHCIIINAIAGSRRGIAKKMEQSFDQLKHYEALRAKVVAGEITEKELSKHMKQD